MKKQADYIKRIEIKRLWGRKDISWELRPDVNILSGVNGIGKSTILNRSVNSLTALEDENTVCNCGTFRIFCLTDTCQKCCNCSTDIISKKDWDRTCKSKHTCHTIRSRL